MITYWDVWAKKNSGWRHYQWGGDRRPSALIDRLEFAGFVVTAEERTMRLKPR